MRLIQIVLQFNKGKDKMIAYLTNACHKILLNNTLIINYLSYMCTIWDPSFHVWPCFYESIEFLFLVTPNAKITEITYHEFQMNVKLQK